MSHYLGQQFRAARVWLGLSLSEATELCGVGQNTIRKLERDGEISARDDGKNRRAGGVYFELIDKVVETYRAHGVDIRPASGRYPAAIWQCEPESRSEAE